MGGLFDHFGVLFGPILEPGGPSEAIWGPFGSQKTASKGVAKKGAVPTKFGTPPPKSGQTVGDRRNAQPPGGNFVRTFGSYLKV